MNDYLDQLASFAFTTSFDALDESAVASTEDVILDTLGAMLRGSREPENGKLAVWAARASGQETVRLIGHGLKAQPMFAALSNATAGVALEVDEGNRWGGGARRYTHSSWGVG